MKDLFFSQVDRVAGSSKIAMESDFLLKYRPWEVGAVEAKNILTPVMNLNYDEVNKDLTVTFAIYSYEPMIYLRNLYAVVYEVNKYSNELLGNSYVATCDDKGLFTFSIPNIIINPGSVIMVDSTVEDSYLGKKMTFKNISTAV